MAAMLDSQHGNGDDESSLLGNSESSSLENLLPLSVPLHPPPNNHRHNSSSPLALLLPSLLPPSYSSSLITLGLKSSPRYILSATHVADDGSKTTVPIARPNNHKVAVLTSPSHALDLWTAISPTVRSRLLGSELLSRLARKYGFRLTPGSLRLNPRLRLLRYDSDTLDDFKPHFDATTEDLKEEGSVWRSYITVLVYLNDCGTEGTVSPAAAVPAADDPSASPPSPSPSPSFSFSSGRTLFLDPTSPSAPPVSVSPSAGSALLFEHDMFHSGEPVRDGVKWIMRTDVFFRIGSGIGSINEADQAAEERAKEEEEKEKIETVEALLTSLSLSRLSPALADYGIEGSLSSLVSPGRQAAECVLLEACEGDQSAARCILDEAWRIAGDPGR